MKFIYTLISLVYISITEATHDPRKCPKNAFYQNCKDLCPKRCYVPKEVRCPQDCVPGCSCVPGYELDHDGNCVHPSNCKKTGCPFNARFRECRNNCPKRTNVPLTRRTPRCPDKRCIPGCDCNHGYELNPYGHCVHWKDTALPKPPTQLCGPNSYYVSCKYNCPKQCNVNEGPYCPDLQCRPGCDCLLGYEVNSLGQCVHPSKCNPVKPPTELCPPNAIYVSCKDNCPKRCNVGKNPFCPDIQCRPGCNCLPGYELNSRGQCVHPSQCELVKPPTGFNCPLGAHYQTCRELCPKRCYQPYRPCPSHICVPGCDCLPGLEVNSNGQCVPPHQCGCPFVSQNNDGNAGAPCSNDYYQYLINSNSSAVQTVRP